MSLSFYHYSPFDNNLLQLVVKASAGELTFHILHISIHISLSNTILLIHNSSLFVSHTLYICTIHYAHIYSSLFRSFHINIPLRKPWGVLPANCSWLNYNYFFADIHLHHVIFNQTSTLEAHGIHWYVLVDRSEYYRPTYLVVDNRSDLVKVITTPIVGQEDLLALEIDLGKSHIGIRGQI